MGALRPEPVSSLARAVAASTAAASRAAASYGAHLDGLVQEGHSMVREGEQVLGVSEAIMDDETGHMKRSGPKLEKHDDDDDNDPLRDL